MKKFTCIICPRGCTVEVNEEEITGYNCPRGLAYVKEEITDPKRSVSSTVRLVGCRLTRVPVKTDKPIEKALVRQAVKLLNSVEISPPLTEGDIVLKNILGTGVNFVVSRRIRGYDV